MSVAVAHRPGVTLKLHGRTAADLMMLNPISMRAEAGINEAVELFTEKGITAAPVIDEAGRPIGVVSRSDLLIHQHEHEKLKAVKPEFFAAPNLDAKEAPEFPPPRSTVADLMTPAVFAVAPDTAVARVVSDMVGLHVHRLFVVDDVGILVGVISAMDVLKHLKAD